MVKFLAAVRAKKKFELRKNTIQPILPLSRTKIETDDDKTKYITLDLKVRAGAAAGTPSYKKTIKILSSGSPQEWIDVLHDVRDIWRQNVVTRPEDRAGVIAAILRGNTLANFETALEDARRDPDAMVDDDSADLLPLEVAHIQNSLLEVAKMVFPHRALETQKLWMSKHMRKPFSMSVRETAVQISRLNNSLPLFPNGSTAAKFNTAELLTMMEYALPDSWRTAFDKKGYTPSLFDLDRLIVEAEILERHEPKRSDEGPKRQRDDDDKT